ncbi:MAG TPA: hypothetical protein VJU14_00035 [Solirubrobacterales bacterium]|nr:hypothetical protein [Solirubrobacterales bacterium]
MATPESQPVATETETIGVPDDANDLRSHHFKRLMKLPLTLVLIGSLALVVFVVCLIAIGAAIGAGGALLILLLGVVVVFAIADGKAASDFFEVYAAQRGMTLIDGRGRLPGATPLLRKGDDRYTERTLQGRLAEGVHGTLALFTYEEETRDSDGNKQTNYYRYTLGFTPVVECKGFVPELYCQRKFGLRALEKFEDAFRTKKERLKLESEVLDKKYEIFAGKEQDAIWLRRLFSPSFIVWLTDAAPDKFAFELVEGNLCCYVSGHKENAAELDAVAAATGAVAKRLRDEALE